MRKRGEFKWNRTKIRIKIRTIKTSRIITRIKIRIIKIAKTKTISNFKRLGDFQAFFLFQLNLL